MPSKLSSVREAREKITNFSRRFSREHRREQRTQKRLPPDLRKGGGGFQYPDENPPEAQPENHAPIDPESSEPQIRPPFHHRRYSSIHASAPTFKLPDLPWLCGTWHITHSTLPMWRSKRNVRITYTRLPANKLDDLVTFQNFQSAKVQRVHGVDTPLPTPGSKKPGTGPGKAEEGRYTWRGKGPLMVATSNWEVLGWGGGGGTGTERGEGTTGTFRSPATDADDQWVVTYFAKTLFTPAGIDIYSRKPEGLSAPTVQGIKDAMVKVEETLRAQGVKRIKENDENTDFGKLVNDIFEVRRDGSRID